MTERRKKTCTGCLAEKALESFYRHPSGKDGRASKCKVCTRVMVKENRELKAEYYLMKSRQREVSPERLAYKREYHKHYVKTASGRESKRITQRIYRAARRATRAPIFPSDHPVAVARRRERSEQHKQQQQAAS